MAGRSAARDVTRSRQSLSLQRPRSRRLRYRPARVDELLPRQKRVPPVEIQGQRTQVWRDVPAEFLHATERIVVHPPLTYVVPKLLDQGEPDAARRLFPDERRRIVSYVDTTEEPAAGKAVFRLARFRCGAPSACQYAVFEKRHIRHFPAAASHIFSSSIDLTSGRRGRYSLAHPLNTPSSMKSLHTAYSDNALNHGSEPTHRIASNPE